MFLVMINVLGHDKRVEPTLKTPINCHLIGQEEIYARVDIEN